MNELQLGLLAIGVVVVLGVLIFNRWQERKFRRLAEQRFQSRHDDILLAETPPGVPADMPSPERVEPVMDDPEEIPAATETAREPILVPDEPEEALPAPEEPEENDDVVDAQAPDTPLLRSGEAGASEAADAPDDMIEYVALLSLAEPLSARALNAALQFLEMRGKVVRWLGQGTRPDHWEDVVTAHPDGIYARLAACLQLADRNGPVSQSEFNAFCEALQALAEELHAVLDCPDKQAALALANELDQFCAAVDVLIGVNIVSRDGTPFAGTKLRGLAESVGMKLMPDGLFHNYNDQGGEQFALANLETTPFAASAMKHLTTHGVTFVFDVPKAEGGLQAFNQMLLAARQFTTPLGALMVDDNRRELSDPGIDKIREQLAAIYAQMAQRGIPPGSPQALRLFA